jgi:hypothetical protein
MARSSASSSWLASVERESAAALLQGATPPPASRAPRLAHPDRPPTQDRPRVWPSTLPRSSASSSSHIPEFDSLGFKASCSGPDSAIADTHNARSVSRTSATRDCLESLRFWPATSVSTTTSHDLTMYLGQVGITAAFRKDSLGAWIARLGNLFQEERTAGAMLSVTNQSEQVSDVLVVCNHGKRNRQSVLGASLAFVTKPSQKNRPSRFCLFHSQRTRNTLPNLHWIRVLQVCQENRNGLRVRARRVHQIPYRSDRESGHLEIITQRFLRKP